jgi:hypothetical protein
MDKDKKKPQSGVKRALRKPATPAQPQEAELASRKNDVTKKPAAPDPTGSCRYADSFGQFQCESPVTKIYCDGKSGFFTEGGRC